MATDSEKINEQHQATTIKWQAAEITVGYNLQSSTSKQQFERCRHQQFLPHISAAKVANELGLGISRRHDLSLQNLKYFADNIPGLLEVSIGHALICDAIYLGLENAVQLCTTS